MSKIEDAVEAQVGGDHYLKMGIQPIQYIQANSLGYEEGNVIKYVSRHASKNGRQDLEKAIHYLELLIANKYPDGGSND